MSTTTHEFSGLTTKTVAEIIGPMAAMLLVQIDHQHLEHGKNWRWQHGRQVFTESGLALIAAALIERGHRIAGERLRSAAAAAIAAERNSTLAPAKDADLVGNRNWLSNWQEQHEAPLSQ